MLETNNTAFKKEIESTFKDEIAEQLPQNNLAITNHFNQRCASFKLVMLQTIKDVVLQMIPTIPQQQHQMQTPFFQDEFSSQQILPTVSPLSQCSTNTTPPNSIYKRILPLTSPANQYSSTTIANQYIFPFIPIIYSSSIIHSKSINTTTPIIFISRKSNTQSL